MKLHDRTPDCAVYFLAGSLPAAPLLHLRQLSLFGMICSLDQNLLKTFALNTLAQAKPSTRSWFQQIREICIKYGLPHPIHLLSSPLPKPKFSSLCFQKVHEYWHLKLSNEANMPSLSYLHPSYLSLTTPHPIWRSLDGNPFQAKAAQIQAIFLTGRYRSERLCRFWSGNREGFCLLDSCENLNLYKDIEHIILHCVGLTDIQFTTNFVSDKPVAKTIVET